MLRRNFIILIILFQAITFSAKSSDPIVDTLRFGVEYYSNFEDNLR
jgi:hypothetical protein